MTPLFRVTVGLPSAREAEPTGRPDGTELFGRTHGAIAVPFVRDLTCSASKRAISPSGQRFVPPLRAGTWDTVGGNLQGGLARILVYILVYIFGTAFVGPCHIVPGRRLACPEIRA